MKKRVFWIGIGLFLLALSGCGGSDTKTTTDIVQTGQSPANNITATSGLPPIPEVPKD